MPYLFCDEHGREHEARATEEQENYRLLGKSVLVVKGTLTGGPWKCDRCNVTLRRGQRACLMTAFPRHVAEGMDDYDFSNERRYFDMKRAEVTRYGAMRAGGTATAALPSVCR